MAYAEPLPLTFRHWAGVSPYTSPFGFAETCVFDKQSPGPLHCDPQGHPSVPTSREDFTPRVPFLPKLQGQVVEFLNEGSLVHLGTFTPAYLCRFAVRTPQSHSNEAFLGGIGSTEFPEETSEFLPPSARSAGTDLPIPAWPTGDDAPCPLGTPRLPSRVPPLL